jgi:hypothetical protein
LRRAAMTIPGILALCAAAAVAVWAAGATLLINFPSISPDGDGIKDEMTVSVDLSSQSDTLIVIIKDKASAAVYDTLMLETPAPAGDRAAVWGGTDWTGALLPEGEYDLLLYESTGGAGESISRTVIIDLTSPLVNIDRIEPGVFSPGWPDTSAAVTVYFTVSGWEAGAVARMTVTDPNSSVTSWTLGVDGDGEWTGVWKPASVSSSGYYTITVTVSDEAGNSSHDSGMLFVDVDGPELEILTYIPSNTRDVPREITGLAYDNGMVSLLELSWTGPGKIESARFPADSTWSDADTLYWRFDTPDTVNGDAGWSEGGYVLKAFARDPFGNQSNVQLSFKLDRTPPAPPQIAVIPERMIQPKLDLFVQFDSDTDSLFVYRQAGGLIDSSGYIAVALTHGEPLALTLSVGLNEIWAAGRDKAGNTSALSNVVRTTLDPTTGIAYPEVFREPGTFQVVSGATAYSVTLEIYDMRGERIRRIEVPGPGTSFDIPWDLTSDDGETVRNGPCLVVVTIDHAGGRTVDKAFIAVVR